MRRDFLQRTQICGSIPEFLSGLPPKTIVAEDARRDEGGAARIHVDAARAHEDALVVALNVFSAGQATKSVSVERALGEMPTEF